MSDEFVRSRQQFLDEQCVVSDQRNGFFFCGVVHRAFKCTFRGGCACAADSACGQRLPLGHVFQNSRAAVHAIPGLFKRRRSTARVSSVLFLGYDAGLVYFVLR